MKLVLLLVFVLGSQALPLNQKQLIEEYARRHPNTGTGPEYGDLWQGDIELDDDAKAQPGFLNAMWNLARRWPGSTIPYTIGNEYDSTQVALIEEGIRDLMDSTRVNGNTCVNIIPRTSESAYVYIQKFSGCSSFVGRTGSAQRMSLVDSCVTRHGTIMHEFLHALGFYHEHTRGDRDDYVYVNFDNIQPGAVGNFVKLEEGVEVDHLETEYDYGSVMHYSAYGFAIDPSIPTIVPLDPDAEIGQRIELSQSDIEKVQIFYCCLNAADSKYNQHLAAQQRDYCDNFP